MEKKMVEMLPSDIIIVGTGGFGRETRYYAEDIFELQGVSSFTIRFAVSDSYYDQEVVDGLPVIKISEITDPKSNVLLAIADPILRRKVFKEISVECQFPNLIHPSSYLSRGIELGGGCIIAPQCTVSCNVKLGKHSQLNYGTSIGHDTRIGEYFTSAPGARISGNCVIGQRVYFGSNASIRQGLSLGNDIMIGMGGAVVSDLSEAGIYIGVPAYRLQ